MMFTEEQQLKLASQCLQATQIITELTANLATATQTISDQAALIKHLSEDNLKLIAKLDALTGKTAPGTTFAACDHITSAGCWQPGTLRSDPDPGLF